MNLRWILASAIAACLFVADARPATEFFPLKDVRPGLKGVGKTCYVGGKPQEFQVEVLGVLHNMGPGTDAILARFSGGPLEQTGVFEGMSGSPVFIDGKLLGAVAFSWAFPKEAIGGITPIQQMVDAFAESVEKNISGPKKVKASSLWNYRLAGATLPGTEALPGSSLQPVLSAVGGHPLVPIATPLNLAGFGQAALRFFEPQLRSLGLTVLQGTGRASLQGGSGVSSGDDLPLEPGANIVVPLVRGDMDASAAGTLTYIDGNKLYAFGHPLFDLGFTELPLHKGQVISLFPSLQSSFKIVSTGEAIGTLRQDRGSGIYGILGQKARMLPIHLKLSTSRGTKKDLNFEVARDRLLTPLLVNLTIFNAITSYENSLGVSTIRVKGKIDIKGEKAVDVESRFTSDSNSPAYAALSIALPVNFLLQSGYQNLDLQNVDLEIQAQADDRSALLDSVRFDRTEVAAGGVVNLNLLYKKANGEVVQDSYPVKIPTEVTPGPVTIMVADGTTLMSMDAREQGEDFVPRDLSQLIKFINNIRKNDRLYIRVYRSEPGAVIKGEGLPALPPSLLSILRSERNAGGMSSIQTSVYMEYELPPAEYIVTGSRSLSVTVKP
jgi:hypothetical protein